MVVGTLRGPGGLNNSRAVPPITSSSWGHWGIPVIVLDGRPAREMIGSKAICQQRDVLDVWESCGVADSSPTKG